LTKLSQETLTKTLKSKTKPKHKRRREDLQKPYLLTVVILALLAVSCIFFVPNVKAEITKNSWQEMAPMPTARQFLGVAVVNDEIYAIGGGSNPYFINEANNINEVFNPVENFWTTKQSMPTGRFSFGVAVWENKIYCIGGYTHDGSFSAVNEMYNPTTNTWETKTQMPTPRSYLSANAIDGKIYLIGGRIDYPSVPPKASTNINEVYDVATDSWSTKTPMPIADQNYGSTVVDGKIYIIGGQDTSLMQIYDPATDSWSTKPAQWHAGAAVAATSGVYAPIKIYIIGGSDLFSYNFNTVYNPQNYSWTQEANMPTSRGYLGVAVVKDVLYAIGGSGSNAYDPAVATTEKYFPMGYSTIPSKTPLSSGSIENTSRTMVLVVGVAVVGTVIAVTGVVVYHFKHAPAKSAKST
jgi:N-acetylneuraminic acid mutarotase